MSDITKPGILVSVCLGGNGVQLKTLLVYLLILLLYKVSEERTWTLIIINK